MSDYLHLDGAPIVEALIDFRVNHTSNVTVETLKEVVDALPPDLTKEVEEKTRHTATFSFGKDEGPQASTSGTIIGYWCKTEDGLNIAQVRLDGFTFSELMPYSNWENFSKKAKAAWDAYRSITECSVITRLAVRYINHLELPLKPGEEFEKYLISPPNVPDGLPQAISNFLKRVTIVDENKDISAHVTQTLLPISDKQKNVVVVLDIDAFKDLSEDVDADEIWDIFSKLKNLKNDIFFGHITTDCRELFE